jgi:hypothetical protein
VAEADPREDRGACSLHPENVAVGTCQRCGNFLCRVCRTRWGSSSLCLACSERLLRDKERSPEVTQAHRRQAVLSLVMGIIAWALAFPSILLFAGASRQTGQSVMGLIVFAWILGLASLVPACFGVGQGVSAVRARGDRLIVATCGLVLSGAYLGLLIGAVLLALWRR